MLRVLPDIARDGYAEAMRLSRRVARFGELTSSPMWPVVYDRLLARDSVYRIVEWWYPRLDEKDPLAKLNTEALARRLYRFRKALPESALDEPLPRIGGAFRAGRRVDVLTELAGAIALQKKRLEKGADLEAGMPMPTEAMRREMLTFTELLRQYREAAIALGELRGTNTPLVDARSINVTVEHPGSSIEQLLRSQPEQIPMVMEFFDRIDALETGNGDAGSGTGSDDAAGASPDPPAVRPVDVGG